MPRTKEPKMVKIAVSQTLGLSYRKAEALLGSMGVPILHVSPGETHPDELGVLAEELSADRRTGSS
jgi:hypothetical protein